MYSLVSQATAIKIDFNSIKDKWNKGINFASDLLGGDGKVSYSDRDFQGKVGGEK